MHGFINVFVAAVVAYQGSPEEDVLAVLNEQSPSAFQWEKGTLTWRHHHLPEKLVKEVRENFAIGFGSCSFTEPVNDLKGLGWL
jgi:hypothetical protein